MTCSLLVSAHISISYDHFNDEFKLPCFWIFDRLDAIISKISLQLKILPIFNSNLTKNKIKKQIELFAKWKK